MIPDELCPHVEIGAPVAGGVLFAAENPEVAVSMCAKCLEACRVAFPTLVPMDESQHVLRMSDEEIRGSIIAEGRNPDVVAEQVREMMKDTVRKINE